MANIEDFFIGVGNKPEPRTTLRENLDIIKNIGAPKKEEDNRSE